MSRKARLTVLAVPVFFWIICSYGHYSVAGDLLSKVELLPNGRIHHIFTNSNVNVDNYPIAYSYANYAIQDNVPKDNKGPVAPDRTANSTGRSFGVSGTKHPAYVKMREANPNDEKYSKLIDRLLEVSTTGSPSVGRKTEIDAINKALRALAPMTSFGGGSAKVDAWRQQDEVEEQRAETQRIKLNAESERDRAKWDADQARRDAEQARREADQAKNEAQWEANRIRVDNIINNRW